MKEYLMQIDKEQTQAFYQVQDNTSEPDNVGDVQRSVDKPVAKLPLIDKIDSKQEEKLTEMGRETPEQKPISEISEPESSQNKKLPEVENEKSLPKQHTDVNKILDFAKRFTPKKNVHGGAIRGEGQIKEGQAYYWNKALREIEKEAINRGNFWAEEGESWSNGVNTNSEIVGDNEVEVTNYEVDGYKIKLFGRGRDRSGTEITFPNGDVVVLFDAKYKSEKNKKCTLYSFF